MLVSQKKVLSELIPEDMAPPVALIDDREPAKGGTVFHREWKFYGFRLLGSEPRWILTTGIRGEHALANIERTHGYHVDRSWDAICLGSTRPYEDPRQVSYQADLDRQREREFRKARERQSAIEAKAAEKRSWWPRLTEKERIPM